MDKTREELEEIIHKEGMCGNCQDCPANRIYKGKKGFIPYACGEDENGKDIEIAYCEKQLATAILEAGYVKSKKGGY